jgi:hypothetical protein
MGDALSMGWCLAIMQKALLWTTVCNMFRENHAPPTINTHFVDLEIECDHSNCCKKAKCSSSPTLYTFSVSVKRRRLGWPPPSLKTNVVDPVDPHLPSVKRCRLRWATPSLSKTSSTRLTHTFPQSNVVDSVDPHLPSFLCNFIFKFFSSWISMNKR